MFGANKVSSANHGIINRLEVKEIFYTLQGEGPDAGRPAVFVRLANCNLRCYFCDTDFENGLDHATEELTTTILAMTKEHNCDLVVITGGEPMLQNILPFVHGLNLAGISCSVETAGSIYLAGFDAYFAPDRSIAGNLLVVSPKTPKLHPGILKTAGAFKYIINSENADMRDGLPNRSTQMRGMHQRIARPVSLISDQKLDVLIYVQPEDTQDEAVNHANLVTAAAVCLRYGYRLSVQMHKLAGLR